MKIPNWSAPPIAQRGWAVFIFSITILLTWVLFNSPGTEDVVAWLHWADRVHTYGFRQGYRLIHLDYPPLASAILGSVTFLGEKIGLEHIDAIKYLNIVCLWLSGGIVFWFSKNLFLSAVFVFGFSISAVGLVYIDILMVPFLLLAVYSLYRNSWALFGLFYTLACFIKWQPLILAPMFAAVFAVECWRAESNDKRMRLLQELAWPVVGISGVIICFYGLAVFTSLLEAMGNPMLSGQAFNLSWIFTWVLGEFVLLDDRTFPYVLYESSVLMRLPPRILFFSAYAVLIFHYVRNKLSVNWGIVYSALAYAAYYMLSAGVHENHMFIIPVLLATLVGRKCLAMQWFLVTLLLFNFNMIYFYGVSGGSVNYLFDGDIAGVPNSVYISGAYCAVIGYLAYFYMSKTCELKAHKR